MRRLDVVTTAPPPLEDEYGPPEELADMIAIMDSRGEDVPPRWRELVADWRFNNGLPEPGAAAAEFSVEAVERMLADGGAEADLTEALLALAAEHGKFSPDGPIHPGYESPADNEDAEIGVTCANCVFWNDGGTCDIVEGAVEGEGRCRFAVIPPRVVEQFHLAGTQSADWIKTVADRRRGGTEAAQFHLQGQHDQKTHGRWFSTPYDGVVDEATDDEQAAADWYTSGQHETMNRWLRGLGESTPDDVELRDELDAVIAASTGLRQAHTLYRGIDSSVGPFAVGDIIEDPAFMSTSLTDAASVYAMAALLEISAPEGTKGIRGEGAFDEFILGRGTRMRVVDAEDDGSGYRLELLP